jgi:hypothetical protein
MKGMSVKSATGVYIPAQTLQGCSHGHPKQGWCHQCISVAYSYPVIYSHYIMQTARDDVVSVISSFVPELACRRRSLR